MNTVLALGARRGIRQLVPLRFASPRRKLVDLRCQGLRVVELQDGSCGGEVPFHSRQHAELPCGRVLNSVTTFLGEWIPSRGGFGLRGRRRGVQCHQAGVEELWEDGGVVAE